MAQRKPIGFQRDFLDAYQPNVTKYLSEPLQKQLHRMGNTSHETQPAGTYSRAILNRLLIDLSWASSLLRDLYIWAYERSTQTYLAIKQDVGNDKANVQALVIEELRRLHEGVLVR